MIYGSVCSGIEAASVAWHPLGWKPAFFSEIEAFPRAVLAHRFPAVPLHGDFTSIEDGQYEPIDLLVGGTPCQDFSIAGLRAGMAGDRGNLTLQFLALAQRLRPKWLVWENVPGVLSSNGGRDFGSFLGGLGELGYGWAYRTLDAQYFGVPQRRRRVFVVGYLGDWRCAAAVLFERHSLQGHPAPSREAGQGVTGALAGVSPGGGWRIGADEAAAGQIVTVSAEIAAQGYGLDAGSRHAEGAALIAGTLNANGKAADSATSQDAESGLLIAHPLRAQAQPSHRADSDTYVPVVASALRARDSARGVDSDGTDTLLAFGGNNTAGPIDCATALAALAAHGGPHGRLDFTSETFIVASTLRARDLSKGVDSDCTDTLIAFSCKDHGADAGETAPTLRAMGHSGSHANAGGQIAVCVQGTQDPDVAVEMAHALGRNQGQENAVCVTGDISHTLKADGFDASEDGTGRGNPIVAKAMQGGVRRLTPKECERLQGFPDDWTLIPYGKKLAGEAKEELARYFERTGQYMREIQPGKWVFDRERFEREWPRLSADGPRYKALGNSFAIPVIRWIGERIQMVEDLINAGEAAE